MPLPRFHCPRDIPSSGPFALDADVRRHAFRVLRLTKGEEVVLFDGKGSEARCRIMDDSSVEILQKNFVDRESKMSINLVQSLVSTEKLDWVVQKAVELGVKSVQIVETKRSVVKLSRDRAKKREAHWLSVAVSACEQCGRNHVPEIFGIVSLAEWLSARRQGSKYLLSPNGSSLKELEHPSGEIFLLAGPEGGLTAEEEDLASRAGFLALSLGPRILRTETAGLAAISAFQALWGDF